MDNTVNSFKGPNVVIKIPEIDAELKFDWINEIQAALKTEPVPNRIYLVSQNAPHSGIMGFVNCLAIETLGETVRYKTLKAFKCLCLKLLFFAN
jgi:hypothetical protein